MVTKQRIFTCSEITKLISKNKFWIDTFMEPSYSHSCGLQNDSAYYQTHWNERKPKIFILLKLFVWCIHDILLRSQLEKSVTHVVIHGWSDMDGFSVNYGFLEITLCGNKHLKCVRYDEYCRKSWAQYCFHKRMKRLT